ncbi:hypothetical protein H4F46_13430 [Pectobacterium brasiliense]|uniref:hypothetical protein n=1 Tax=Pectobacterium brasiliense TaxID=180957 RepID=UPI001968E9D9|nr:hypothetical protein [Pectobacterium brasiliense]MBN3115893.1 hypothetical protein [Pectobacterium brasiliense]
MKIDNPVKRLINVLNLGKEIYEKNQSESPHKVITCRRAWRMILNLDAEPDYVLFYRIGEVMALPYKMKNILMDNFDSDYWKSNHWEFQINEAFKNNDLNSSWNGFITKIDDRTITELKMMCLLIETKGHINDIDSEKLSEFKVNIENIKNEVINSNISKSLKDVFVKYLKKIIDAIDGYQISGVEPIMEAVESTLGHAFVDENYKNAIKENEFGSKIVNILSSIANAVTIAEGLPAIGATFLALLPK